MPVDRRSPLLDKAVRASCYFDRKRRAGDRRGGGRWVSLVTVGSNITITEHDTENEARRYIGLNGGSKDPLFRPQEGDTRYALRPKIKPRKKS